MRKALLLAAIVLIVIVPVRGAAQVARDSVPGDTVVLDPVVVSATRVPLRRSGTPGSVTVLDGAELRRRGVRTLGDALRETPAIAVVQSGSFGGTTSIFVRGGESDYTKVLVDGVPLNAAGGAIDLAHITLHDIERIEIVRGPVSVLYGSDAVAGVIQLFTRRGHGRPRLELRGSGGTFDTRGGEGSMTGGGGLGSFAISGLWRETDGIHEFNSGYRNSGASVRLRSGPAWPLEAALLARYSDATFHFPTTGTGAVVDSNQVREEERVVIGVDLERQFGARVRASLHAGASEIDGVSDDQPDSRGDSTGFYSRVQSDALRRTLESRVAVRVASRLTLTAGAELQAQEEHADDVSQFQTFPPVSTTFGERRTNHGYYTELHADTRRGAVINAGARIDDNSKFGDFTTWRVAALLPITSALHFRASGGTAFKEPAFIEQFNTAFSRGNPRLHPERSRGWEAGIGGRTTGGAVRWSAAWFSQDFEDLIQYIFTESPDSANYFNIAAAEADGVELELTVRPLERWELRLQYANVRTEVTDPGFGGFGTFEEGKPLLRRPRHSGAAAASWQGRRGGASAVVSWVGARDDLDFSSFPAERVKLGGYATVDLAADLSLVGSSDDAFNLALTARMENVLDRDHAPVLGFRAPGRTVLIGGRIATGR